MKEKKYDVVVGGYLGVDLAPGFHETGKHTNSASVFKPGSLTEVGDLSISLGGVVANTGSALKYFGQNVVLMGLVGNDLLGDIARKILSENGLSDGIMTTDSYGTAYGIVLSPPGLDRMFFESAGCNNYFQSSDINYDAVAESRLFHFGYPPLMKAFYENNGKELETMYSKVKALDTLTSLDMTLPDPQSESGNVDWNTILTRVLPYVDIFVPSIEEIVYMMRPDEYARAAGSVSDGDIFDVLSEDVICSIGKEIIGLGVNIALIKCGKNGAYLYTGDFDSIQKGCVDLSGDVWKNRAISAKAFPVDPARMKNASGAGDVAVAAFLTAVLNGHTPEIALQYSMCAGRNNLYGMNATDGLTDWETMTEEINR